MKDLSRVEAAGSVAERLRAFAVPDNKRAWSELAITMIPLNGIISLMYLSLSLPYVVTLALAIPAALFLMRVFTIQHDCGHGSFFKERKMNDRLGHFLGLLTLTPYEDWKLDHALHHAWSGNLDRRGNGDITTWTVEEFAKAHPLQKLRYRAFRHPLVMFFIIPIWQFVFRHRWPAPGSKTLRPILSVVFTNVALVGGIAIMGALIGYVELLMVLVPIILCATSIGVWMFYVQHQFEETDWGRDGDWNRRASALEGSSYFDMPAPLMWVTGYIGMHHAHHLNSRVPFYRLPDAVAAIPELNECPRITLSDTFSCARLALWDEARGTLVSFKDAASA
ncbi:MAG: fatty acid desaturase [Pseudomonadota bacterium]